MALFLLVGLALAGLAVALFLRASVSGEARSGPRPLDQIESYGFARSRRERTQAALSSFVDSVAGFVGGFFGGSPESNEKARAALLAAGMYKVTPRRLLGYRVFSAAGLPILWLWFGSTFDLPAAMLLILTVLCAWLGWMAPLALVRDRAKRRLAEIDYELPELIDLLVVTVEAGLGFVGSLQLASTRIKGPLGEELRLAMQEQNMGLAANESLEHMLGRCDTPSMRSFVRSIIQGETLGVSIGQILRDLAREMRRRRKAEAEERAQKAPIKILFPLVFMIFPAMFIVLLGPAVFALLDALKGL